MAKKVKHRLADDVRASMHDALDHAASSQTKVVAHLNTGQAGRTTFHLREDEREGIERGLTAMREGRFASDEQVAAIQRKARILRK